MAETKREIERKYESDESGLPDLTGVAGVEAVVDKGVAHLDATYYDTGDERLAASSITLRRRTGGSDAGWHLKFPIAPDVRDEIHAPLSDTLPDDLAGLVRSRVRDASCVPVVRLRSARDVRHLLDADGRLLAEVSVDAVHAERLTGRGGDAQWTEIEVELADGGDPAFLDKVEKRLRKAGVRPSASASKLARALAETAPGKRRRSPHVRAAGDGRRPRARVRARPAGRDRRARPRRPPGRRGLRAQHARRHPPDAQHLQVVRSDPRPGRHRPDRRRAEVARRRAGRGPRPRGADRAADGGRSTRCPPTWSAARSPSGCATWASAEHGGARGRLLGVLDSRRYLALLDTLDALIADPPLLEAAGKEPGKAIAKAVRKDFGKVSPAVEQALDLEPGTDRDVAMHEARKKAKRTRYAAEAAPPPSANPPRPWPSP